MESTPAPQDDVPPLVFNEFNRWCVDDLYEIYMDTKMLNDKMVMNRLVTLERRILIGSLDTIAEVHSLFTRHSLDWMAISLESYSEVVIREF